MSEHVHAAETCLCIRLGPRSSETFSYFGYLIPGYAKFKLAVEMLHLTGPGMIGADSKTMVNLHQVTSFQLLQPLTNIQQGAQTCC